MNRKLGILLAAAFIFTYCGDKTAEISGILENPLPRQYIFLQELKPNELLNVDSAIVSEDGSFEFKRKVKFPSFYLLKINQNNFLTMLIEPGEKIKMTSHFDSLNYPVAIIGSKGTKLIADYNKRLIKTRYKLSNLNDIYDRNSGRPDVAKVIDSLDNLGDGYLNDMNSYAKKYIDDNVSSLATIPVLYSQLTREIYILDPQKDLSYFLKVDSSLFKKYPEYGPVIDLHNQIKEMVAYYDGRELAKTDPGERMEAPEIALPSPEGDTIKLTSTRGSFVLLDFWASWCAPCRMENPNLVKAWNLYRNKGFKIYQVSLDKTKEAWIKGIQDDGLDKWIHVSDVSYWQSVVVPLYKIESIPANYLLDKEGRVIATNLRGDALQRKLAEIFK
jgi:thiol-disulfide isomerase/thioredoxin